jgi:hypothetical protein
VKKIALLILTTIFLHGCASFQPTIPEGYSGEIATIEDTAKSIDSGKADMFYLSHIDGKAIKNSRSESLGASYGQGNNLRTVLLKNRVPAEDHVFTIVGRTEFAMPIRALSSTVYKVKGDVAFSPVPNEAYIIKGVLSEERSAVWIERILDGKVIDKIEVEGPSKLGFFEK